MAPAPVICSAGTPVDSCFVGLQPVTTSVISNTYSLFISSHLCARPFADGNGRRHQTEFKEPERTKVPRKLPSALVGGHLQRIIQDLPERKLVTTIAYRDGSRITVILVEVYVGTLSQCGRTKENLRWLRVYFPGVNAHHSKMALGEVLVSVEPWCIDRLSNASSTPEASWALSISSSSRPERSPRIRRYSGARCSYSHWL